MAKATEPALTTGEIVFELEQFERSSGRLTLSGRWFGVRGRRFVRPTLTLVLEGERVRALADLDDKPWPAEDGEPWRASFPWVKGGQLEEPELSVAPDIRIQLPSPRAKRARPQRLAAQPRRETMTASWGAMAGGIEAAALKTDVEAEAPEVEAPAPAPVAPVPEPPPEPQAPAPDPSPLRAEIDGLRVQLAEAEDAAALAGAELETLRGELSAALAQLDEAHQELGGRGGELEATHADLAATRSAREAALRSAAQAEAEREDAMTRAADAEAQRDALATEKAELTGALEQSRSTVEQLSRQRDEVATSHGAALVMRGATQALPAYEHHVGWFRRGLALILLLGIVFALLIVLGAL